MENTEEHIKKELSLGLWEKYLTLWIALCIIAGLLIGSFIPAFGEFMDSLKFAQVIYSNRYIAVLYDVPNSGWNTI